MRFLLGLFLGALSLSCSGKNCTLIGCTTYAEIVLSEPLTEEGEYHIRVIADDLAMTCVVSIPRDDAEDDCSDDLGIRREEITTGQGGAESGIAGDAIESIGVIGVYDEIEITIERSSALLLDDAFEPEYQEEEINGPGCGGCPRARHEVEID